MKILIISQYFWPESFRVNDLAIGLKEKGHEVSVLTGLPNYPSGHFFDGYSLKSTGISDYHGAIVCRVPLVPRFSARAWQLSINYVSFVFSAILMGPFFCRDKYDVIFVFEPSPFTVGLPGVLFRFIRKCPMIFWVQDLWPESLSATDAVKSPFLLNLVSRMVRYIYKRCDRVLIQSRSFKLPAIDAGADSDRIDYFPNWAEQIYRPLEPDYSSKENAEIPQGFRVMFAGNLGRAQSLSTILEAANKLREYTDIKWILIGDGSERARLEQEVIANGLQDSIIFTGRKSIEAMPIYFSLANVLLVLLKDEPVFRLTVPSKLQSYLASGKPVIGALSGEGASIIDESGAGFTVSPEHSEQLAEAIKKMYELPATELEKMGRLGRKYYISNFDRDMLLSKLETIMQDTQMRQ